MVVTLRHRHFSVTSAGETRLTVADKHAWMEMEEQATERKTLTLLWLWSSGLLPELELATVANDDGDLRPIFLVCRDAYNFRNDVFIPTDHPTEYHVFPCGRRCKDQSDITTCRRSPNFSEAARIGKGMEIQGVGMNEDGWCVQER